MAEITVYGAPWCPDCIRSKRLLEKHHVSFDWRDVDQDAEARRYVVKLQHGRHTIPTIVFPDGSYLIEPSDGELSRKLGLGT